MHASLKTVAINRLRGHLGRLKTMAANDPALMHQALGIERALAVFLGEIRPLPTPLPFSRDPYHFDGRHLSAAGRDAIEALFGAGVSTREAAERIGISLTAAANARRRWLTSVPAFRSNPAPAGAAEGH